MTDDSPKVRIGMIQGAERISFTVKGRHRVLNENGIVLGEFDGSQYHVTAEEVEPGAIDFWVRVGIYAPGSVQEVPSAWRKKGLEVRVETVGTARQFGHRHVDNREDWLLVGPFSTREEAELFRRSQTDFGDYTVIEWVSRRPRGHISLSGVGSAEVYRIEPVQAEEPQILLHNVLIGIDFHWQRYQNENLRGTLELRLDRLGRPLAINELSLEPYLASVSSSEMSAESPVELLKAQTVAARSTVLATMGKHHFNEPFDLCADDHCQCYYGADREEQRSWDCVRQTWGQVLVSEGSVCDARYSKICGGIMEDYRYVWDSRHIPYLICGVDGEQNLNGSAKTETGTKALIDSSPDVWCNLDRHTLPESLAERCRGLFRWRVRYKREELEDLIRQKTGIDFGQLRDLVPLQRGCSGRIVYLDVVGSRRNLRLGKELEIRRALSDSHLYSSCFYVEKETDLNGEPRIFTLKGAGWGHGVGLCQVGATVMAQKGRDYRQILSHYYKNSTLTSLY